MRKPLGIPKLAIAVLAAAGLAASAYANLGSIISSFPANFGLSHSVCRDADYVYIVTIPYHGFSGGFYKYTPTGSRIGFNGFIPSEERVPEDADVGFLGPGYLTVALEAGISTYNMEGFFVREDHHTLIESIGYAYRTGGPYYYVETGSYKDAVYAVYRFDTTGSLLGSFTPAYPGSLAATDRFDGMTGEYLIAAAGTASAAYTPLGSVVATFPVDVGWHMGCGIGPGYPASYGPTLWIGHYVGAGSGWIYQIDLGNATAVEPTSLGKVRAVFK